MGRSRGLFTARAELRVGGREAQGKCRQLYPVASGGWRGAERVGAGV